MNILVSHFGKQYCHELLRVLEAEGWLSHFHTSIAEQKTSWLHRIPGLKNALRKRHFPGVPAEKISHAPALFALERTLRNRFPGIAEQLIQQFDRRVADQLQRQSPDLVIGYENCNLETFKKARRLGKTTVLDLAQIHHEDILDYARWFMPAPALHREATVVNPRKAEALGYTDYILTLSDFAAESMLRHGWPADRLFTVRLGIDLQRFRCKTFKPTGERLRLLFVGTMTLRKGLGVLMEAIGLLPPDRISLTLIGPMADAAGLLKKHEDRFRYLPFLHHEALAEHYREADLFVFPSLLDSWAQTVLEAMACGTPAIVTELTGAKDAVQQGGGWVIPANAPEALAAAILHCLENPQQLRAAGEAAHRIAQGYTREQYSTGLKRALRDIANRENIFI